MSEFGNGIAVAIEALQNDFNFVDILWCAALEATRLYVLAQKVHSTPNTQQAERSWLHTRREQKTCQSIFLEN
jgi:hypothetical protein